MVPALSPRSLAALGLALILALAAALPARAQDGARSAASAREAAAQLRTYLDARATEPLNLAAEPAAGLFARIYDNAALAALPPPQGADVNWLIEWAGAAATTYDRLIHHRTRSGAGADAAIVERNILDNQDRMIAATSFIIRLGSRMITSVRLFLDGLPPKTRQEPARQQGYEQMVGGVAQTVDGALSFLQANLKPENARLLAQALRDTAPVWAPAVPAAQRSRILSQLLDASAKTTDPVVAEHLAAVRQTFSTTP